MVDLLKSRFSNPFVLAAIFCAVLFYSNFVKISERHPYKSLIPLEDLTCVEGTICSNSSITSSREYYIFSLDVEKSVGKNIESSSQGRMKILVDSDIAESLFPGRLYSVSKSDALLEKGQHISCKGHSLSSGFFLADKILPLEQKQGFFAKISYFRSVCRLIFRRLMYSWGSCGALILSLIAGCREYADSGVQDAFRCAGLSHVLALSGMHLSFFASLSDGAGTKILGKKHSFWAKLLGILFFVWFAGLSPSLYRALLCSLLSLFCSALFCFNVDMFCILCCAFLIHCVSAPQDLFNSGFILSYAALAEILLFSDFFKGIFKSLLPENLNQSVSASISAQGATSPISAAIFGQIAPIGIISSVVVSPIVSFFLTASIFSIVICLVFPFLSGIFGKILNAIYSIIIFAVRIFAKCPMVEF